MNTKEYIESGIIESYVLGMASEEERLEFEQACASYPEVKAAREAFEIALENQALATAVAPPPQLKGLVMEALSIEAKEESKVVKMPAVPPANVVVMDPNKRLRFVAAAAVVLFLISSGLNFYYFNQYKSATALYDNLVKENTEVASNYKKMEARYSEAVESMKVLQNPNMVVVKMAGSEVATSPDPSSLATIYWDAATKDVYLMVNKMPVPKTTEQQYQLWALVDGVPVDAGVFDIQNGVAVLKMKNIPKAEAFAVTLEKRGGSPTPHLEQLYVLGKVS